MLKPIFTRSDNVSWKISPGFDVIDEQRKRKRREREKKEEKHGRVAGKERDENRVFGAKRIPKWSVSFETIVAKIWRPRLAARLEGLRKRSVVEPRIVLQALHPSGGTYKFHWPTFTCLEFEHPLALGYFQLWNLRDDVSIEEIWNLGTFLSAELSKNLVQICLHFSNFSNFLKVSNNLKFFKNSSLFNYFQV